MGKPGMSPSRRHRLETVTAQAKRVVKQHQDLLLSNEAFDLFIAELEEPAKAVPELTELFTSL